MTRYLTRRAVWVVLTAIALTGTPAHADDEPAKLESLGPTPEETREIVEAANTFAWRLHAQLANEEAGNVIVSPSSIHAALTMAYTGAKGETATQLHAALALPSDELMAHVEQDDPPAQGTYFVEAPWDLDRLGAAYGDVLKALAPTDGSAYELRAANALWGQAGYPWREEFVSVLRDDYGAGLQEVDVATPAAREAARKAINAWVAEQTRDNITEIVPADALDELTHLVPVSAVYFKAAWAKPFDVQETGEWAFQVAPGKIIWTPTMEQIEAFDYAETDLAEIVRLPYLNDEMSMIVFLPKQGDDGAGLKAWLGGAAPRDRLPDVEAWLSETGPTEALAGLTEQKIKLYLPTFEFAWEAPLVDPLKAMGIVDAVDPARSDLTGMSDRAAQDALHISRVLHAAYIDVDEDGTEAAAAAALIAMECETDPLPKGPRVVRVNRPFVFAIRHEATGVLLFVGRVVNPRPDITATDGFLLSDGHVAGRPTTQRAE